MLIYIFLSNSIYSQTVVCGTDEGLNPPFISNAPTNSTLKNSYDSVNFCLNVYFNIVGDDAGLSSIPAYYPNAMLTELNEKYREYNIQFKSLGIGNINNSNFTNIKFFDGKAVELFSTNNHWNAIDIYIADSLGYPGLANGVHTKELVINTEYALSNILIHEMGHCLNLLHTHSVKFGKELVDGSNSETAGDQIRDTPADPDLSLA